jgi:hypothetical protein
VSISWVFTEPGIGGIIAVVVLLGAAAIYIGLTRWVLQGGREEAPPREQLHPALD